MAETPGGTWKNRIGWWALVAALAGSYASGIWKAAEMSTELNDVKRELLSRTGDRYRRQDAAADGRVFSADLKLVAERIERNTREIDRLAARLESAYPPPWLLSNIEKLELRLKEHSHWPRWVNPTERQKPYYYKGEH